MNLTDIHRGIKKHKKTKRLGRGKGTGQGKTAGRGHKGQGQRAGWTALGVFEGGQMPLVRRVPKRGFNNKFALSVAVVNLEQLDELFQSGEEVTVASVRERHLARGRFDVLKVLGNGELTKALKISAHRFSKSALEKIQKAGGEAIVLPGKAPVVKNKQKQKVK
jgi:large subunit ribosomal protein L15